MSLIFPYIRFICDHEERIPREGSTFANICLLLLDMFDQNILTKETLTKIEEKDFIELSRLYLEL